MRAITCDNLFEVRARGLALTCLVTVASAVAASLAGCGGGQVRSAEPGPAQVRTQLQNSPGPLAALHAEANRLLGGGVHAYEARLKALRGYPVVVNKWGSWCVNCQIEFPVFQRVSVQLGRRVAFLGLDGKDFNASATSFLRRYPVSFPSFTDPDESIARAIEAATFFPQTIFYNRRGQRVYVHAGPYLSASGLIRDVRTYAQQ